MTTQQQYEILPNEVNEQQWRLYLGTEALKLGYGGISQVVALSGADWKTVQRGVKELKGEQSRAQGRIRQAGGGRKKVTETDPTLQRDLEELLEPKGDPMSLIKWTSHSLAHLVKALAQRGHRIKKTALAEVLHELGYALKANKKTIEGASHADRDQQFGHINALCKQFEQKQAPAISVDCKKKELLGTVKNQGREWQPKGQQTRVNVYDYRSLADGKAIPYGIYEPFAEPGLRECWASIMRRQHSRWKVSGGGGSTAAKSSIPRPTNC